jgi:hypothetical protein
MAILIGKGPDQVPTNGDLGGMAYQDPNNVRILRGIIEAQLRRYAPVIKTAAFTVARYENWLICNGGASITVTLPTAATNAGREIMIKTIAAFTVVSASSNVKPIDSNTAGTAILPATAGAWATLVCDGTDWIVMQRGT